MFTTLSSYLFGSSSAQEDESTMETTTSPTPPEAADAKPCRLKETQAEEEWVLVDKTSREVSPERCPASSSAPSSPEFVHPASRRIPPHTALGLHSGDTSGDSDIGSDISTLPDNACSGETWLVTPPPCFTAGGSSLERMEQNPLENLLIEHPSMSVYGPRLRQNSAGVESNHSESSEDSSSNTRQLVTRGRAAPVRSSPRRPRAVAARAGLSTNQQTVKAAQVAQRRSNKRQLSAKQLTRCNKVRQVESRSMRQRHSPLLMQPGSRACKRC